MHFSSSESVWCCLCSDHICISPLLWKAIIQVLKKTTMYPNWVPGLAAVFSFRRYFGIVREKTSLLEKLLLIQLKSSQVAIAYLLQCSVVSCKQKKVESCFYFKVNTGTKIIKNTFISYIIFFYNQKIYLFLPWKVDTLLLSHLIIAKLTSIIWTQNQILKSLL